MARSPTYSTKYTEEEVQLGLVAYALANGNHRRCAVILSERGLKIPEATVRSWATMTKRELYQRIRAKVEDHVNTQLADAHFDMAYMALDIEQRTLIQIRERLEEKKLDGKELASIARTAGTNSGIHTEKAMALSGKPTQIIQHDFSDIQRIIDKQREEGQHKVGIQIASQPVIEAQAVAEQR